MITCSRGRLCAVIVHSPLFTVVTNLQPWSAISSYCCSLEQPWAAKAVSNTWPLAAYNLWPLAVYTPQPVVFLSTPAKNLLELLDRHSSGRLSQRMAWFKVKLCNTTSIHTYSMQVSCTHAWTSCTHALRLRIECNHPVTMLWWLGIDTRQKVFWCCFVFPIAVFSFSVVFFQTTTKIPESVA